MAYNHSTLAPGDDAVPEKTPEIGKNGRTSLMIKELPPEERPREKLKALGAGTLSEAELLAIILRVGVQGESVLYMSHRLLMKYGGLAGLARTPFAELCEVLGLGEAKACQLKSALEIGPRSGMMLWSIIACVPMALRPALGGTVLR